MLVRGVIVDDQVHLAPGRGFAVDLVEKADELLMPVAAHALADDLAVEHVERGEQGRARHTCFCGLFPDPITASSRSRSPGPSRTSMPFLIRTNSHICKPVGIIR